jgi:hypothetical protein
MKTLIIILTFAFSLFAQHEWSEPIQLSETGIYSAIRYKIPAITVDSTGNIYAFWVKDTEFEHLMWYSQIEYRKSTDGGLSWGETVNITPEYDFYRITEMKAVCDSEDNVHLLYLRGGSISEVTYKKFDKESWTKPHIINNSAIICLRIGIDSSDRIYSTWYGGTAYYSYCDTAHLADPVWTEAKEINGSLEFGVKDFTIDKNNNLHVIGTEGDTGAYSPLYCRYNRSSETWTDFAFFDKYTESSHGQALALSSKDTLYSNVLVGNGRENLNYNQSRHTSAQIWSDPEYINKNNGWDYKKMFVDIKDNLHLFETNLENSASIVYSNKKNGVWSVNFIQSDTLFSYGDFDAAFDYNERLYLVFREDELSTRRDRILFRTKLIDTSIDDNSGNIVESHELYQNYPNPFNPVTQIKFALSKTADVRLSVYNIKGEFVKDLINAKQNKGQHSVIFNAGDLNSGIYFYRLEVDGIEKQTRKMLYLK